MVKFHRSLTIAPTQAKFNDIAQQEASWRIAFVLSCTQVIRKLTTPHANCDDGLAMVASRVCVRRNELGSLVPDKDIPLNIFNHVTAMILSVALIVTF